LNRREDQTATADLEGEEGGGGGSFLFERRGKNRVPKKRRHLGCVARRGKKAEE